MGKDGKTLTIFLSVISILLLSLTGISLFFYSNESRVRMEKEAELAKSQADNAKFKGELTEAKKKVFRLEEGAKEADEKINSLLDELDLQEGLREEMKIENSALRDALSTESRQKASLEEELLSTQEKVKSLEGELEAETKLRTELREKTATPEEWAVKKKEVELGKIVVTPEEIPEGKILSTNRENNFVIFDLGKKDGIFEGLIMSVFRKTKYLGDVKVARVQSDMSVADAIPPLAVKRIRKNDKVVVKE